MTENLIIPESTRYIPPRKPYKRVPEKDHLPLQIAREILTKSGYYNDSRVDGWRIFVVDQRCGKTEHAKKYITIPYFIWEENPPDGFLTWYCAHELSHALAGPEAKHGTKFMGYVKTLCPPEYIFFETWYKPYYARKAGIT